MIELSIEDFNRLKKELIESYKTQIKQIEEIGMYSNDCNFSSAKNCAYEHQKLLEDFLDCDPEILIENLICSCQGFSKYWEIKDYINSKLKKMGSSSAEKYLLCIYDLILDTYCDLDIFWKNILFGGHEKDETYQSFRDEIRSMRLAFEEDILLVKSSKAEEKNNKKKIKLITERIKELELE